MHFPPKIWEENGGASYSLNVAYLAHYRISALKDVIKYFTTFFASKIFPYFSPRKPGCILWSKKYGKSSFRNIVQQMIHAKRIYIHTRAHIKKAGGGKQKKFLKEKKEKKTKQNKVKNNSPSTQR